MEKRARATRSTIARGAASPVQLKPIIGTMSERDRREAMLFNKHMWSLGQPTIDLTLDQVTGVRA